MISGCFRVLFALLAIGFAFSGAQAYNVRVHCAEDTMRVHKMLDDLAGKGYDFGTRVVKAAHMLEGTPWASPADNDTTGTVVINLHGFDRLGFMNTVLALAEASERTVPRVSDFETQYESYSRRKGEDTGFASQLFYGADWIIDNVYRGHLNEMTEYPGGGGFKTKTFDYLTRHRDDYPALKNEETYDKVRMYEMGYRSLRIPHLKKQSMGNKSIHDLMRNGDIIMMLSPEIDYDIYDIGFVEMRDGEPYLIHISRDNGLVVADPYPVSRLFKLENQHFYGYRWLRPGS